MNKLWSDAAWDEYLEWQHTNRKLADKINQLIINEAEKLLSAPRPCLDKIFMRPDPLAVSSASI